MSTFVANPTAFPLVDGASTIAVGVALPVACFLVTGLRLLVKFRQHKRLGADDWFCMVALSFFTGMGVVLIWGAAEHALGYATPRGPNGAKLSTSPQLVIQYKCQYIFKILMVLAYGSIKASITFFYRRLFVTRSGTAFDIMTKVVLVVIGLWTLTFELICIFDCGSHVDVHWYTYKGFSKYCGIVGRTGEEGLMISDLILNFIVILMPLPWVWQLKISWGKRAAITGIFLLGASAVGASIARLVVTLQLESASEKGYVPDANLEATIFLFWCFLEAGLALIAACLPTLSSLKTVRKLELICNNMYVRVSSSFSSPSSSRNVTPQDSRVESEKGDLEKNNASLTAQSKESPRDTQDTVVR